MDALTFRKKLLEGLDRLTDKDVEKIRNELDLHHDYAINQNGLTHIVEKNIDTLQQDKTEILLSKIDMSLPKGNSNNNFSYKMNINNTKTENFDFKDSNYNTNMKVYIEKRSSTKSNNYYGSKNRAMRKAA
ncbi:hypothetical protein [Lactobacillus bombicola]|uniref:hypothetical protein n=1 Tax=Lactobacillus bombicola TaxID=1505723 RepID=UPI000E5879AB|nr:hypothetical protein [Lactobacillus bombicola]RHW48711.1 hypothetical protein DS833_07640 [Lactobacillus bombicola]